MGDWRVAQASPPFALAADVVSFWESGGNVGYGYEKMVPRGTAEIIFNLAGPQAMYIDGDLGRARRFDRHWVSGIFDKPLFVGPAYDAGVNGTHLVGVSIAPSSIHSLLGFNADEFRNQVVDADALFGREIDLVWEEIGAANTTADRFAAIAGFLARCKMKVARPAPFSALFAIEKTYASAGQVSVADLCGELGVSRKHLSVLFKRTVGMTPKAFSRLTRFRRAMQVLEQDNSPEFADMALELGFSDQAHFVREFASFAGESPTHFLRSRSSDGESVLYEP